MTTKQQVIQPEATTELDSIIMKKQIGATTFEVSIHFSGTSKETAEDKILRMIEREVREIA